MGQPPAIGSAAESASGRHAVGAAHVAGRTSPGPHELAETAFPSQTYGQPLAYPEQPRADAAWPAVVGTPPRRRWRGIGVALAVVAALLLVAGIGAAWVLVGPASTRGTATPAEAVEGFLGGIYNTHNARDAGRYVCKQARNDAELDQTVFEVKQLEQSYDAARTTWSYPEIHPAENRAEADVTLTMTTANDQSSSRTVTLVLVDDRGWWVCDVE